MTNSLVFTTDTDGNTNEFVIHGEVEYIDSNNVTLTFSAAFAGKAYLN